MAGFADRVVRNDVEDEVLRSVIHDLRAHLAGGPKRNASPSPMGVRPVLVADAATVPEITWRREFPLGALCE